MPTTPPTIMDDYITSTLLRDLVGHDHRPASFLVLLWLTAEQQRRDGPICISYQDLAESTGLSKSSAQSAIAWLLRRKLLAAVRPSLTATPTYSVLTPWKRHARKQPQLHRTSRSTNSLDRSE